MRGDGPGQGARLQWVGWACLGLVVAAPGPAHGAEHLYCVDQSATVSDFGACPGALPCSDGVFPTIAAALATAAGAPAGDTHDVCVVTPAPHVESLLIDRPQYGASLTVRFAPATFSSASQSKLCAEPSAPGGQPLLVIDGGASPDPAQDTAIVGLDYRASVCLGAARPLLRVNQANASIATLRTRGVGGFGLEILNAGFSGSVALTNSRIEGTAGPLLRASGDVTVFGSELSGGVASAQALVSQDEPGSTLRIEASTVFGNVSAGGAPIVSSAGPLELVRASILGNTALDGAPLIEVSVSDGAASASLLLSQVVVARNLLLGSAALPAPSIWERPVDEGGPLQLCLPFGSDQLDYISRPVPSVVGVPSAAALVRVVGTQSLQNSAARVLVDKSYFVEQLLGDGSAIFRLDGTFGDLEITWTHDLFVGFGQPPLPTAVVHLIDGSATGHSGLFSSALNVLRGSPLLALPPVVDRVEASMDAVEGDPAGWYGQLAVLPGVAGPPHPGPASWSNLYEVDPALSSMPDCQRIARLCPDMPTACSAPPILGFCGIDGAMNHVPTSVAAAGLAAPWPWTGAGLPPTAAGDPLGSAGPWGGGCLAAPPASDLPALAGDSDGATTLLDCDNADSGVTPLLPLCDGFSTPACDDSSGSCYLCPYGPVPGCIVGDDDDSAGDDDDSALVDDDDSAPADDDDSAPADADGDGVPAGLDCDDTDPAVYPGALEFCDAVDSDCDGSVVDEDVDSDGDGQPDCIDDDDDGDGVEDGEDCAPLLASVYPGAPEVCDGLDSDCDGVLPADEVDVDGDGAAPCAGDCDDADPARFPGAAEVCDRVDTDCDPTTSAPGESDADGDGVLLCEGDCDDHDPERSPALPEVCNGRDDDCDPATNEVNDGDGDGDGLSLCDGDCDDRDATVFFGAEERCDGLDTDCDPATDENADVDGDGFSLCQGDCDDRASARYPGAPEQCNGRDDSCQGVIPPDEADEDGDRWLVCNGDCDDASADIHPGAAEVCDAVDQDCDGDLLEDFGDPDGDGIPSCLDDREQIFGVDPSGCTGPQGCGVGWSPAALLLLPGLLVRRRRSRLPWPRPPGA